MADPSSAASSRPEPGRTTAGRDCGLPPRGDYGSLARRIGGWATNGLATALILVGGLTFGRQVLIWWKEEPAQPAAGRAKASDMEGALSQLQFGALATAVQTRTVRGSRDDVLAVLRDLCRPAERPGSIGGSGVDEAERRLITSLAYQKPVESGDGWRIDQLPQGLPLVVCTTTAGNRVPASGTPLDLRIVSIGLAFPAADGQWSAFAFRLDQAQQGDAGQLQFPLPADCIRGITLQQEDGTVLATFHGMGDAAEWEEHFRTRPPQSGWQIRGNSGGQDRRRLEFDKGEGEKLRAQVHFEYDGHRELRGLLLLAPDKL